MQIIVKQKDIEEALGLYLQHKGLSIEGDFSVDFTAKRGDSGVEATITLGEAQKKEAKPSDAGVNKKSECVDKEETAPTQEKEESSDSEQEKEEENSTEGKKPPTKKLFAASNP